MNIDDGVCKKGLWNVLQPLGHIKMEVGGDGKKDTLKNDLITDDQLESMSLT